MALVIMAAIGWIVLALFLAAWIYSAIKSHRMTERCNRACYLSCPEEGE